MSLLLTWWCILGFLSDALMKRGWNCKDGQPSDGGSGEVDTIQLTKGVGTHRKRVIVTSCSVDETMTAREGADLHVGFECEFNVNSYVTTKL
jgi:hypothetical protein